MLLLSACALLLVSAPQCEETLLTGASAQDYYGWDLASAGDVDGDGLPELLIGAPQAYVGAGYAELRSGRTGLMLRSWSGLQLGEEFGRAVAGAGDVDADGAPDLLIGAPYFDAPGVPGAGRLLVYSGATNALLLEIHGTEAGGALGFAAAGAGDLDGDGRADFMAGEPGNGQNGGRNGAVRLYSGATGALIRTHFGSTFSRVGMALARAGDLDGDAVPDVLFGADGENDPVYDAGAVYAHSGATGALVWRIHGWEAGDQLGVMVAGAGDWDADGRDDFAATARGAGPAGVVRVISGRTGQDLLDLYGSAAGFGNTIAGGSDYDGDGRMDLVIGATLADGQVPQSGAVGVYLGPYGTTPFEWITGAAQYDFFGARIAVLPDRNGDGRKELAVSAPWSDRFAADAGAVSLLICGQLRLLPPSPGLAGVVNTLAADGLTAGATAHFLAARQLGATPVPGCAGLVVDLRQPALLGSAAADAQGAARLTAFVPAAASGALIALQAVDRGACRASPALLHRFP